MNRNRYELKKFREWFAKEFDEDVIPFSIVIMLATLIGVLIGRGIN